MTSSQARLPLQIFFSLWSGKYGHTLETSTILPEAASLWLSPICHKSSLGSAASRDLNLPPSAAQENPAVSPYEEAEEKSARSRVRWRDTKGTSLAGEGARLCAETLCNARDFRSGGRELVGERLRGIIWKRGEFSGGFLRQVSWSAEPGYLLLAEPIQCPSALLAVSADTPRTEHPRGLTCPSHPQARQNQELAGARE